MNAIIDNEIPEGVIVEEVGAANDNVEAQITLENAIAAVAETEKEEA